MSGGDEEYAPSAVVLLPLPTLTGAQAWALIEGLYALAGAVEGHYEPVIRAFLQDRDAAMAAAAYARLFGPDAGAGGEPPGHSDDEPF